MKQWVLAPLVLYGLYFKNKCAFKSWKVTQFEFLKHGPNTSIAGQMSLMKRKQG